jgi:hypothetical protein
VRPAELAKRVEFIVEKKIEQLGRIQMRGHEVFSSIVNRNVLGVQSDV